MYVAGLVIPVPQEKIEAYRAWAENGARIFKEHGCLEIVESWEDFVPDGKQTDFRRAVAAKAGEKIVFTWQVWPDKASFQAAEGTMHGDGSLDTSAEPPFDARRLILGCFEPIVSMGRGDARRWARRGHRPDQLETGFGPEALPMYDPAVRRRAETDRRCPGAGPGLAVDPGRS